MKKKIILMSTALLTCLSFSACTKIIRGKGPTIIEKRAVTNFNSIDLDMSGNVYVRQDSFYKVEVHAQQNVLDALRTSVSGGKLEIDFKDNTLLVDNNTVEVYISCPNVDGISLNSSGSISMLNKLSSSSLDLEVNSSGKISLVEINTNKLNTEINGSGSIIISGGWASTISSSTSGSGSMNLLGAESDYANVHISGSGTTKVNVQKQLDVDISGSGDVYYMGNPSIHSNISGSGRVRKL